MCAPPYARRHPYFSAGNAHLFMPPPPDRLASPMAGPTSEPRAWLEAGSLLNLCRLAVKHGVSIDTCETKEAVVQVLLAVGEGLLGQPGAFQPSPSATPMDVDEEPGGQVSAARSLVVRWFRDPTSVACVVK